VAISHVGEMSDVLDAKEAKYDEVVVRKRSLWQHVVNGAITVLSIAVGASVVVALVFLLVPAIGAFAISITCIGACSGVGL
jgi:hypothetical protein